MSARLSLSILAALAVLAAGRLARAADSSSTNEQIDAAEEGNPASVDYARRPVPQKATNAEIGRVEQGNPEDVDNKDAPALPRDPNWKADWEKDDSGTPAEQSAQPDKR